MKSRLCLKLFLFSEKMLVGRTVPLLVVLPKMAHFSSQKESSSGWSKGKRSIGLNALANSNLT